MSQQPRPRIAIVDYKMGNLFSVSRACEYVGMQPEVTDKARDIMAADAVILPGVGAFPHAMRALKALDLAQSLRDIAAAGRPLIGICLGQQLLMSKSDEFGYTEGLDLIPGVVVRLVEHVAGVRKVKVPNVEWLPIRPAANRWNHPVLDDVMPGEPMYFVHSYQVKPECSEDSLAVARHGEHEFCAAVGRGSVIGMQFHPERSGAKGVAIYSSIRSFIGRKEG